MFFTQAFDSRSKIDGNMWQPILENFLAAIRNILQLFYCTLEWG